MAPVTRRRAKLSGKSTDNQASGNLPPIELAETMAGNSQDGGKRVIERKTTRTTQTSQQDGQKLAVRTREKKNAGGGRKKTLEKTLEVQIPSSAAPRDPSGAVADSQEESEEKDPEGVSEVVEPQSASRQLEQDASYTLASQPTKLEVELPAKPKAQARHVVFGDDEDVDKFVSAAAARTEGEAQQRQEREGTESDSDDDDAPEAVSTQAAAKVQLESAKAANEALEKHAASLKRKRHERDVLLKQQAQKRKRADEADQAADNDDTGGAENRRAAKGRRRLDKANLPAVLPAELLTDSPSEGEGGAGAEAARKVVAAARKPKKITFEAAVQSVRDEGKRPRDEIVGATRYRVLAQQGDAKLAPKMHKNTRLVKEDMLRRRRMGVPPGKKKGFFAKR
ncbi:hypothetical protein GGR56DRAFT_624629 [Xylariaceae sp. FL0804]|nr:hypothetical protein GGR56DRAFT_624629 [Xylariaceae sp. FL0804]